MKYESIFKLLIANKNMRKLVKVTLIILIIAVVVIQFFQPDKNKSEDRSNHIFEIEQIPENIKSILSNSCLDCHSNNTNYKWYHKPAPVSWMVNQHIVKGKDELNLSDWGEFDIYDRIGTLEEICKESERKTMPLKSYTAIHRSAKLSDEQIAELCAWTEKLGEELLNSIK